MSILERVPPEIFLGVFSFLSKHDVTSLCLVCRQWAPPALTTLYQTIHLKSYPSLVRFYKYTHHARRFIRSIHLRPISDEIYITPPANIAATVLADCTALKSISIQACPSLLSSVDVEQIMSALNRTPLEEVMLKDFVPDAGLVTAIAVHSLRRLRFEVKRPDISYDVFIPLARGASQLEILQLHGFKEVTDAFVCSVVFELRELQELSLDNCVNVTEGCFVKVVERCPRLRSLKLRTAKFSDAFLEELGERLGRLRLIRFKRKGEKVVWASGHCSPFPAYNKLIIIKNKLQALVWRTSNFTISVECHTAIFSLLIQILHFDMSAELITETRIDRVIEFAMRNDYSDDDPFHVREQCELLLEKWDNAGWRKGLTG